LGSVKLTIFQININYHYKYIHNILNFNLTEYIF